MRRWSALLLMATIALAGCSSPARSAASRPLRLPWQEVTLPVPPGPAGRIAVRDATACRGTWYVVGAVLGPGGASRPAAWRSEDGQSWQVMPLAPSSYYARRAILYSVACRDAEVAALGERSGGAHGNRRVTSWRPRADGSLVDVHAPFELYGGPQAVDVERIQAGPQGWLITGNRLSGGTVWVSADATGFRIVDHDPALASNREASTSVLDQVPDAHGWTVVGRVETPGRSAPSPAAWTSPDGMHWTRQEVPAATADFGDVERVAADGGRLVAVGLRDRRFGTWSREGGAWTVGDAFGSLAADLSEPPFVSGLVAQAGTVLATVSDGSRFRLWTGSGHHWREISTPQEVRSSGDTQLTVASDGHDVLLLSDDGTSGRVWATGWNTLDR